MSSDPSANSASAASASPVPERPATLAGHQIVCIGHGDWDPELATNQHHLMSRLGQTNKVLFVESLGLRRPRFVSRDVRRIWRRLRDGLRGVREDDGVHVLSPFGIPAHGHPLLRAVNGALLRWQVGRAARRLGFDRPLLWSYVPQAESLIDLLEPSLVVYHCVDDLAAQKGVHGPSFRAAEERFAPQADLVLASAPSLASRLRTLSPNVVDAPNVADVEFFATALQPGPVDEALARLPRPRIVFTGAVVPTKIDMEWLVGHARERPDWSFALVGPIGLGDPGTDVSPLRAVPNIHLLGARPYGRLPDVLRSADAGLIPYALNALTASVFPMKVYEYIAAGLPVVSTALPALRDVPEVTLVDTPEEAAAALTRLIETDSAGRRRERSASAAGHAWSDRLEEIGVAVGRLCARPHRTRVVYLDHTAKLSGGEIALLRLLPHLEGVDAHVILAEDGPLRPRLEAAGVSVEVLLMPAGSRELRKDRVRPGLDTVRPVLATLRYSWQLARRLRALEPDLVHTNSLKAGVYGCIAGRLARVPVVWHVRDRIAADYLPEPAVRGLRLMLRHLPAAVIVNSRATMATVGASDPFVVHSVVPEVIQVAAARERPTGDDVFCVGIVGRLAPWKGQDLFLRAFAAAFPGGDERAVIVGAAMFGEDDYAHGLTELARSLGIADRVEFRGFCDDVLAELARLQILVHASLTAEPFGQVILEGMASGVPVIATDGGGPSEIITSGVNGLLFTAGDVGTLAQLLRTLRADEGLRDRLAAGGLKRAHDFSPAVASARVLDVYRRALA
jgi:glycosyltransferase involved in cell wall biosynthesis